MNLGKELVSHVLYTGELKPFLDTDLDLNWLSSETDHSAHVIFDSQYEAAYRFVLRHYERHRKVPSLDIFRRTFPGKTCILSDEEYTSAELLGLVEVDIQRYVVEEIAADIKELNEAGEFAQAAEAMAEASRRIRNARVTQSVVTYWDDTSLDYDKKIDRKIMEGIHTGIKALDDLFPGFPKGSLITYLGCAKAGKTSFLLLSALASWLDGKRVMFLTVEMSCSEITDKLDGMDANIPIGVYQEGRLRDDKRAVDRLLGRREDMRLDEEEDGEAFGPKFIVIETAGAYTVSDLEDDIDRYTPDVVYIDGFYFLIDRHTKKPGANWEGHDNLSRELKETSMRRGLDAIVTTMQVREKQLKRGSMDDSAMMGGTGLIMSSHMVFGFIVDRDTHEHTVSNTRSRTRYLPSVKGTWDWDRGKFDGAIEEEYDDSDITF